LLRKGLILDKYILLKHLFDKSAQGGKKENGQFENIFLFPAAKGLKCISGGFENRIFRQIRASSRHI